MRQLISDILARLILPYAKAWVGAGVALLVNALASWGLDVPVEVSTALTTALAGLVVWLVPNIPYAKKD